MNPMSDWRLLLFMSATAVAMGVAIGLAPAVASRSFADVERDLRTGARSGIGPGHRMAHAVLLGAEVAIACVVLIGAALLMRSLGQPSAGRPRVRARRCLDPADLDRRSPPRVGDRGGDGIGRRDSAACRATRRGAAAVSLTGVPLPRPARSESMSRSRGRTSASRIGPVSPGYFDVFGIRLIRGRLFSDEDAAGRCGRR